VPLPVLRRVDSGQTTAEQAAALWKPMASWLPFPEAARALAACDLPLVRFMMLSCGLLVLCGTRVEVHDQHACAATQAIPKAAKRRSLPQMPSTDASLFNYLQVVKHGLKDPDCYEWAFSKTIAEAEESDRGPSHVAAARSFGFGYSKACLDVFRAAVCSHAGSQCKRRDWRSSSRDVSSAAAAVQALDHDMLARGDILRRLMELASNRAVSLDAHRSAHRLHTLQLKCRQTAEFRCPALTASHG